MNGVVHTHNIVSLILSLVKKGQMGGVVVHQVRNATTPLTRPLGEDRYITSFSFLYL